MRTFLMIAFLAFSITVCGQQERDTVLSRCPVYITDTVSSNNFFLEFQPATLKVFRVSGNLNIILQQRDQFFSLFFGEKKLRNTKYSIVLSPRGKSKVAAKYSFRSGDQVSYVDVKSGAIESIFDKEKNLWHLKITGMIANLVERSITYYKVKAEYYFK